MSATWTKVLAHTEDMLSAARSGVFEKVSALEIERRALLKTMTDDGEDAKALLGQIVERDRELIAVVEIARQQAADLLRQARQTQAGAGAYLGVATRRY
jgi:hypothetical protein